MNFRESNFFWWRKCSPPGPGWVEGPSVRETRVRRKMLRNCRGSSGFSFFKRFSFFFTRFFGFLFKRFFRFLFLPFQNILFFWENLKGSSLILHPSGLTLFAFAPYTRRTYSALARFFSPRWCASISGSFFPSIILFSFWQYSPSIILLNFWTGELHSCQVQSQISRRCQWWLFGRLRS